jgi:hypothetical protein
VVVGITATCPYGIGACWGGAHEALGLTGVALVHPVPNAADSTAEVRLGDEELPDLATCRQEFGRIMNGTYELRGVEVTLRGRSPCGRGSSCWRERQDLGSGCCR